MDLLSRLFARKEEPAPRIPPVMTVETKAPSPWSFARAQEALAWARNGKSDQAAFDPFKADAPPPGTLPKGGAAMAMDDTSGVAAWAFNQVADAYGLGAVAWQNPAMLALLAQKPEHRNIVGTIAREMTREWIKISATGDGKDERVKHLEAEFTRLRVRDLMRRVIEGDGYQGRGHLFLDYGTSDDELQHDIGDGSPENAASNSKIASGKLKDIRVVEAMWVYPAIYNTSNPLAADWYRPQAWFVQGRQVHASRLLTMVCREVPDILKPRYRFGGLAMTQIAEPYVQRWEQTVNNISRLVQKFSVSGVKTNLATLLSNPAQIASRIQFFNQARDNHGTMLLDKDTEEYFNVTTPLGTLDRLQAQAQEQMASIPAIPIVKLLGITPSGLNASSEGEITVWDDTISAGQEAHVRPMLDVVFRMAQRNLWGQVDPDISYSFEPLRQMTQKEMAEIEKLKADTGQVYLDSGVISQHEERQRVANDALSPYKGLDIEEMPDLSEEEEEGLGVPHAPDPRQDEGDGPGDRNRSGRASDGFRCDAV